MLTAIVVSESLNDGTQTRMQQSEISLTYEKARRAIGSLPRFWKRTILVCADIIMLAFALWASFALRFGVISLPNSPDQLAIILSAPAIAVPIFASMGMYRAVIRYLPERTLWTIFQAMTSAALCWVALLFLSEMSGRGVIPRAVPVLYWALGTILVSTSRFAAKRILLSNASLRRNSRPVVIYGAGEAGAQMATALKREGNVFVAGFIDDAMGLQGRDVAGIRVSSPNHLPSLVERYGVKEIIISMPSVSAARRKEILASISGHGLKVRALPHIADLVSGKYLVSQIREIDIDELLGRSSVPADPELVRKMVEGRAIMVTGAGGSIGSELCRLIAKWSPQRLVLFEANEFALYRIEREFSGLKDIAVVPVLGSITDRQRVEHAIGNYGVEVVFHAAAHKHVPLVEANALEGIRNNVFGTQVVADTALRMNVESFVLISSDKAVRPTNVMGATKRWAELIVRQNSLEAYAKGGGQRFSSVRFGNVLGSNGSVVPLFKEQIAHGGPVTLTDPDMTRYFMSIHEAAELIVQAGALSEGGDVFLLDMGSPVLIKDLAENMIRLAGFSVRNESHRDGDIEIVVTGKRPGEKMFEELFYDDANAAGTKHPKIMRAIRNEFGAGSLSEALEKLKSALAEQNEVEARRVLFDFIQ